MASLYLLVALCFLLSPCLSLPLPLMRTLAEGEAVRLTSAPYSNAHWFSQTLNHFDNTDPRDFLQRYYVNDAYWDKKGPIIMYINGEGPVYNAPYSDDDEVVMLAKTYNGLIVTLEHRYYGLSLPFDDLSFYNLRYLSSRQALNDLADFMVWFRSNTTSESVPYVTIGASYSGALSAWFRVKYPHLTVGSISSSGVVNAILDFTAFDEQVSESAGPDCAAALRETTHEIEKLVFANSSSNEEVKARFNASMLTDDGDFFYFIADAMAESLQYGYHYNICMPMQLAYSKNSSEALVDTFATYVEDVVFPNLGIPIWYSTEYQQNTSTSEEKNARQWWFQKCSELAYFQNAPSTGSIRSSYVNMTYHKNHCQKLFGTPIVFPDTAAANTYYGGNHTAGTNIYFANGSQDPWRRASVMSSLSASQPEVTITCDNCGHGVDLRGCPYGCSDEAAVDQARAAISEMVGIWLSEASA